MPDFVIRKIKAREILDSRGNPTLEVEISTRDALACEQVPSGASTGIHEALELRDGQRRYDGKGVLKAVNNVNSIIARKIIGMDVTQQQEIDRVMLDLDGTGNKSSLGANAILGVSLACARCSALTQHRPLYELLGGKNILPIPFMNIINGGKHADTGLNFQEFMIAPKMKSFSESLRAGAETYHALKGIIAKKYGKSSTAVGDEGGFAPQVKNVREALDLLMSAITAAGYSKEMSIAIDAAASEFFNKGKYSVDGKNHTADQMVNMYERLTQDYPIVSIEDPFEQDDYPPFKELTHRLSHRGIQIVGDDLLVTNPKRIMMGMQNKLCTALLLKVNQIGTLTESLQAARMALDNKWNVMVSHRSGETISSFIADLAVGLGCRQIKAGAPCRSERLAKYNRLLQIEEELSRQR